MTFMNPRRLEIYSSHPNYGPNKPKLILVTEPPMCVDMNVVLVAPDCHQAFLFAEHDMREITKYLRNTYEKTEKYVIKSNGTHWDVQHQQSSFTETCVAQFTSFDDAKEYKEFKNKSC
jgi:hypothetical protein